MNPYEILDSIYLDPKNPASFSSISNLYNAVNGKIDRKVIKDYLATKISYTRHFPKRKKFKRRKIIAYKRDDIWSIDLAILDMLSHYNSGYKYLLVCIDILSNFIWVEATKKKTGDAVSEAFKTILKRAKPRKPKFIASDHGTEFYSKPFFNVLDDNGIKLYSTKTGIKSSNAERAIRNIKNRLFKFMTEKQKWSYISVLQDIVNGINNSKSRVLGNITPAEVNRDNEQDIFNLKFKYNNNKIPYKYKLNDVVRKAEQVTVFSRGFRPNYSASVYKITNVLNTDPHTYQIAQIKSNNELEDPLLRLYYAEELVPASIGTQGLIKEPPKRKKKRW